MADAEEAYRIAEERIAAAKATGAKALNLSLSGFLIGDDEFPGDKRLRALATIPPDLAGLTALNWLGLSDTQAADLAPLAGLTALERLDLSNTQAADLAPLAGLTALNWLGLSGTQAADLAPLAGLTALQTLDLSGAQAADLAPLAGLTALTTLDLRGAQAADLAPLAGLTALNWLYLSGTQAADLAPLAGLTALKTLYLSGTQAADLAPLAGLTALEWLDLSGAQAADLAPLAGLTALKSLLFMGAEDDPLRLVAPGAPWEREDRGLERLFLSPDALGDAALKALVEAGREPGAANAPAILARLREIRDERAPAPPPPPAPRADDWRFEAAPDGRLRLSDAPLGADADQAAMQGDLRRRAEALAGALAGSNEFAGLAEDARRYALLLERDAEHIGAKAVWALSCIFRAALAADEAAEREGRANDQLPPLARAALTGVVTIGGAWLLDHPGVAAEEAKARNWRAGPGEEKETEAEAAIIASLGSSPDLVEPEAMAPARDHLRAVEAGGPLANLSRKAVFDAARGAVVFILRAPFHLVRWTGNSLIWIGGALDGAAKLSGAAYLAARLIMTHETAIRIWLMTHAPEALRYFDALYRLLKSSGF